MATPPIVSALVRRVLTADAALPASVRRVLFERARRATNDPPQDALAAYVDKVAAHAYRVTDEDVARLREQGYRAPQIFEATVTAAVGAAWRRLSAGLNALYGGSHEVT